MKPRSASRLLKFTPASKMGKNKLIEKIKLVVLSEALDTFAEHSVKYKFHKYNSDIKMIFVRQHEESLGDLNFSHVKKLQDELKKINERFLVGIFYTQDPKAQAAKS